MGPVPSSTVCCKINYWIIFFNYIGWVFEFSVFFRIFEFILLHKWLISLSFPKSFFGPFYFYYLESTPIEWKYRVSLSCSTICCYFSPFDTRPCTANTAASLLSSECSGGSRRRGGCWPGGGRHSRDTVIRLSFCHLVAVFPINYKHPLS